MRIAIDSGVAFSEQKAGVGQYGYNLIHHLAQIDKKNLYILYDIASRDFRKRCKYIKGCLPEQDNFRISLYRFNSSLGRRAIPVELLTGKVDVLHTIDNDISPVLRAKRVVTIHDILPLIELKNPGWEIYNVKRTKRRVRVMLKAILKADRIIAVSENTKNDIIRNFSVDPSKISVIYLGKDVLFRPLKDKEKIKKTMKKYNISKRFLLCISAYSSRKNLVRLLVSFQKIRQHNNCQLVIFGKPLNKGRFLETLDNLSSSVREDVIITGYIPLEDVVYLYNGAEFFIYPSLYEGFGLPVLEAMSCGCPVITSNTSSLPEVAGDAGILIDPYNLDEMTGAMERLPSDEKLREELKVKGLKRAELFTWEETARKTLQVYEEVYRGYKQ